MSGNCGLGLGGWGEATTSIKCRRQAFIFAGLGAVAQGEAAAGIYRSWRAWLLANGRAVVLAVLAVVGATLATKGLVGLVSQL